MPLSEGLLCLLGFIQKDVLMSPVHSLHEAEQSKVTPRSRPQECPILSFTGLDLSHSKKTNPHRDAELSDENVPPTRKLTSNLIEEGSPWAASGSADLCPASLLWG